MHYYNFNISDYRKDTVHLTLTEHAIYRALIDLYYLDEQELCADDAKLMRSLCVRSADEEQAYKNVIEDFFIKTDKGYFHKKCDAELSKIYAKSEKARLSALKRWGSNANAKQTHSDGNANGMLPNTQDLTPNKKTKAKKDKPKDAKEVEEYAKGIDFIIDGQHFIDYQDTRGWKLKSGQPIKDWKACIRTWKKNGFNQQQPQQVNGGLQLIGDRGSL